MYHTRVRLYAAVCVLLIPRVLAIQNKVHQVYLQTQQSSDLDHSASGYVYRSDGNGPATYINLGGHPAPSHKYGLVAAPSYTPLGQYVTHAQYTAPNPVPQYVLKPQPVYVQPVAYEQPKPDVVKYSLEDVLPVVDDAPKYVSSGYGGRAPAPVVEGSEEDASYKKGGGSSYNQADYAAHGEKGDKGYQSKHGYDQGAQGKHDKEGHEGHYASHGGHKAGYNDKTQYHSDREAAVKGAKGGSFHDSNGHKKGSKTTGFHNVYHKDEYKKDHTFYDESDNSGHHEKYGEGHANHAAHSGGYKKGGNGKAGYLADHHGKKGYYDKGHYADTNKGHKGEHGSEQYHSDAEKYGKKGGHQDGNEYGYSHGDGHSGKYHH